LRLGVAAALAVSVAVPAQAMSVAEFLARARALQAMGALAPLYPDYELLRGEMRGIVAAYRADINAARAAGRPPHSCPPSASPQITAERLLAELERLPLAQRRMSMKAAFYGYMKRHYPCR
jgi:hypothetical protein